MRKFSYMITDEMGIHARPAGLLVKKAAGFKSSVKITKKDRSADAKGILGLMSLGIRKGDAVEFQIEGPDEEEASRTLEQFLKDNL